MYYLGIVLILSSIISIYDAVSIQLDKESGSFSVSIYGNIWFKGDEVFVYSNGKKYSNHANTQNQLYLTSTQTTFSNNKILGEYKETSFLFESEDGVAAIECIYEVYKDTVIFKHYFPIAMNNTNANDMDAIITSFPTFDLKSSTERSEYPGDGKKPSEKSFEKKKSPLGYAHWVSWHYEDEETVTTSDSTSDSTTAPSNEEDLHLSKHRELLAAPGFISPDYGLWSWEHTESDTDNNNAYIPGGISGTGVTAVYDGHNHVAILCPYTNFMSQSHSSLTQSSDDGLIGFGIMGLVNEIPAGYSQSTILYIHHIVG